MEKEGLKDLEELQCYMIARMEAFLTSKGKRMIGWDEVLNNHLAPTSTIISYRGQETASEAANRGYKRGFHSGSRTLFRLVSGYSGDATASHDRIFAH